MKKPIPLKVKRSPLATLPTYGTPQAAGADLYAAIEKAIVLAPQTRCLVPTGLFLEIPSGYEVQIRSRSGLALKQGVVVLNSPGTIDSDYRGELCIILFNCSTEPFSIEPNMRIAQMILAEVEMAEFIQVEEISDTTRGTGGFGSTGVK